MLAEHDGDLPPAVDPAQLDLPAGHEAEEQDQGRVLGRQRALRFHASAKFLVEPLNCVRRPQRLPLGSGKGKEQRLLKTGGRLIRHARYFTLQLAESYLTGSLFRQMLARMERLAWHPT